MGTTGAEGGSKGTARPAGQDTKNGKREGGGVGRSVGGKRLHSVAGMGVARQGPKSAASRVGGVDDAPTRTGQVASQPDARRRAAAAGGAHTRPPPARHGRCPATPAPWRRGLLSAAGTHKSGRPRCRPPSSRPPSLPPSLPPGRPPAPPCSARQQHAATTDLQAPPTSEAKAPPPPALTVRGHDTNSTGADAGAGAGKKTRAGTVAERGGAVGGGPRGGEERGRADGGGSGEPHPGRRRVRPTLSGAPSTCGLATVGVRRHTAPVQTLSRWRGRALVGCQGALGD